MENIRLLQPDIFHTSDLLYDNHMEVAFFRCNELPLPTLSYLSTINNKQTREIDK